MIITSSTRQGLYIIFALVLAFATALVFGMSWFEYLIICIFAQVILKLTDIEEAIRK